MHKQIAKEIYRLFSEKEGSEHIASEGALRYILKYLKRHGARKIIEIGTGIGTVCFAVKQGVEDGYLDKNLEYYGTEVNEFCKDQIKKNIKDHHNVFMFESFHDVPVSLRFDFAVVDGQDEALVSLPERMNRRGIIFIEGGRKSQVKKLTDRLRGGAQRNFVVFRELSFVRRPYGPFRNRPYGGGSVIILEPIIIDRLYALIRNVATSLKYRGGLIG